MVPGRFGAPGFFLATGVSQDTSLLGIQAGPLDGRGR